MINFLFQYIPEPIQYIDITLRREVQGSLYCMELLYSLAFLNRRGYLLHKTFHRFFGYTVFWVIGCHYSVIIS